MDAAVAVSVAAPPSLIMEATHSTAPDRPGPEELSAVAAMDTSDDASQPQTQTEPQSATHGETETQPERTAEAPAGAIGTEVPEARAPDMQESQQNPTQEEAPSTPAPDTSLPPPPPPPAVEIEPATWADIEEDLSSPDEAELKEIESTDGDYSAYEYDYWEKSFYRETDDPEYRPAEKARLTWKIKGVRGTKEQPNRAKIMRSPPAYVGGYWWTIKFFPRGNGVGSLSVYLECSKTMPKPDESLPDTELTVVRGAADANLKECQPEVQLKIPRTDSSAEWLENYKKTCFEAGYNCQTGDSSEGTQAQPVWRVSAQIGVILYNPDEPRTGQIQSSCHQFNTHNLDWGWTNFHGPWDQIHRRQRGQRQALLRNDTLAFDAYIRVFDDPTKSLWWHSSDSEPVWDSLTLTGYRPMGDSVINHSAEVAGLAAWVHLAPFRQIIERHGAHEHFRRCDVKPRPLCAALQEFLWRLRCENGPGQYVETDKVTSTLRNLQEFSGDVVEFWERLRRTLQLELAGFGAEEEFAQLFDSPSLASHEGQEVNRLPSQLTTGIKVTPDQGRTIQEAVSKYLAEKPGQWALPPVLHVEICRQRFNHASRQWKLHYNRMDLDEVLDLAPCVVDGQCGDYDLYGFIIHRGRRTSGKFFSILRPGGPNTKWLAFDDGSDNRVECLTRKAALEAHVGLDETKLREANDKTGHDSVVAVLYVRRDVVKEYLPGKLEPWTGPEHVKKYFETGVWHEPLEISARSSQTEPTVQVEIYGLPSVDEELGSLFDSYDLMSQSQRSNNVMYMTLPRNTSLAELRKKIAFSKSTESEKINSDRVRLWEVGKTKNLLGATLLFDRLQDLNDTIDKGPVQLRFWTHVLSEDDAKLFRMPDPLTLPEAIETKPDETVEVHSAADSDEQRETRPSSDGSEAAVSSSQQPGSITTPGLPSDGNHSELEAPTQAPEPSQDVPSTTDVSMTEATENDAAIAAVIANVIEQMGAETTPASEIALPDTEATPAGERNGPTTEPVRDAVMEDSPAESPSDSSESNTEENSTHASTPATPEVFLPVPHIYYFIQIFDAEKQVLRFAGAYFSPIDEKIKSEVRKHLKWADDKDFLMWSRVDGTSITSVSPADTFWTPVRDGVCIIVGDKLSKDQRAQLGAAGLFTNPDLLVQYIWASSRNHPTRAFTGTKTIDATFNGDYYSGEFNKGYYHGKGTHISDSGTTYTGDFIFGQRHGKGLMEYPSGDTYDGDWIEDQRHGQGTFVERKSGNRYVGGYKDGKRHGKGISYWEVADEEMDLCQICYSEEQDALFYDCGHVCACVTCANQVEICPICRKNVISVVKIYKM